GFGRIKAAIETSIRGAAVRKRVHAEQAVGLTEQRIDGTGLVELRGVLQPIIRAAAAFDAVPAGEFVNPEEVSVVKHQALRVLGRPASDLLLVWSDDHLRNWFYRLRTP